MIRPSHIQLLAVLVLGAGMAGCTENGVELQQWMQETKQSTKVSVPKLSEPKKFIPFLYDSKRSVDPYNPN